MKNMIYISAICLGLGASAALADAPQTGLAALELRDARSDRPLEGFVWYPAAPGQGPAEIAHGNPVWQGIEVIMNAEAQPGPHPFVVLSHGMYGNAMNQTWLADALVEQGFVVAAVSHPGTSTWARDPDHARALWDRPGDISRVIDHALGDPALAGLIDPDRIYMAGHSLGGFTALALAGGRFDAARFDRYCASDAADIGCRALQGWGVAQTDADRAAMQADLSDPRIRAFALFDLGGTQAFDPASLSAIDRPMLVIGAPEDIAGMNLEMESRALAAALPAGQLTYLEPDGLSHFDFMGLCSDQAVAILQEDSPGDEIICRDGGAARAAAHAMIAKTVVAHFQ